MSEEACINDLSIFLPKSNVDPIWSQKTLRYFNEMLRILFAFLPNLNLYRHVIKTYVDESYLELSDGLLIHNSNIQCVECATYELHWIRVTRFT